MQHTKDLSNSTEGSGNHQSERRGLIEICGIMYSNMNCEQQEKMFFTVVEYSKNFSLEASNILVGEMLSNIHDLFLAKKIGEYLKCRNDL